MASIADLATPVVGASGPTASHPSASIPATEPQRLPITPQRGDDESTGLFWRLRVACRDVEALATYARPRYSLLSESCIKTEWRSYSADMPAESGHKQTRHKIRCQPSLPNRIKRKTYFRLSESEFDDLIRKRYDTEAPPRGSLTESLVQSAGAHTPHNIPHETRAGERRPRSRLQCEKNGQACGTFLQHCNTRNVREFDSALRSSGHEL